MNYVLSIDQSTQGTKALLLDGNGKLIARKDLPHEQKISDQGWVSHDPMEIYRNMISVARQVIFDSGIEKERIAAVGISNQRETSLVWDRDTGLPVADAVVWQCARAQEICERPAIKAQTEKIRQKTGMQLSPYFPAAKIAWLLENAPGIENKTLCAGTIDSWLIYKLTGGKSLKTDYSNASRTQLFNIHTLAWDEEICKLFGIPTEILPEVCMSDSNFGETDFEGFLPKPIPIHGVLGDSHGALFGQGCVKPGMGKATYGTGSSVMMNIGETPVLSESGVVTSLAWGMDGKVEYVLEGNINYTGAVTTWIVSDVHLLDSPKEAGQIALEADPEDGTYLVPAFTGLGAPYWNSDARAMFCGMSRTTGRAELVKAAEECIAYQIADVVEAMNTAAPTPLTELRADGGPTRDKYLMQFQSDILHLPISIPENEELSGMGAGYCAGIAAGIYPRDIADRLHRSGYTPQKGQDWIDKHFGGWKQAVQMLLNA